MTFAFLFCSIQRKSRGAYTWKNSRKHFKFGYVIPSKRVVAVPDPEIYDLVIRLIPFRIRMSELEKSFRELSKTENVFLFVPNLIGYGRIVLALLRYRGHLGLLKQNIIWLTQRIPNYRTHFSFWFMPTNYVMAAWCYILSGRNTWESIEYWSDYNVGLLDAVDGHAARLLGQSSKFGAMLDMLTDRHANIELPSLSAIQNHNVGKI